MNLRLDSVNKNFLAPSGKSTGVRSLNFSISKGEGFSLLGPSGCGKTTTLRLIGGFERADSGKIWLGEKELTHLPPQARPIRTVFQRYALFPHLNVWENVVFGLRMQKRPESEVRSRGERIVDLIEIRPLLARSIDKLSGGEQQRVALARALITEPEVLLLDEPFSALDLKLRERLQLELLALKRKLGTTFVFVTHDQTEAMLLSDRIAVMRDGSIEQIASPEELYWRPANKFVASFIGQANFLNSDDAIFFKGSHGSLPILKPKQEWMVRAERLRVHAESYAPGPSEVSVPVKIIDQVFRGQERLYRVQSGRGQHYLVSAAGRSAPTALAGQSATLTWNLEDTWVVDASS